MGANLLWLGSRSPFGAGRRSGGAFISSVKSSYAHPRVGTGGREEDTSVPISREEVTSRHHLSAMPDPLQPPLSLRTPCPEGIRQRRPRRERVCDDLSTIWFRRSVYDLYLGDTHGVSMCGYSRQPWTGQRADSNACARNTPDSLEQAIGLISACHAHSPEQAVGW